MFWPRSPCFCYYYYYYYIAYYYYHIAYHYVPRARTLSNSCQLESFTTLRSALHNHLLTKPQTQNKPHLNKPFICILNRLLLSLLWSSIYLGTHTSVPALLTLHILK
jgi:hypothetical protein